MSTDFSVLVDITGNVMCIISCVGLTVLVSELNLLANSDYTTSDYSAVNFVCNNDSYTLSDCSFVVTYNSECQTNAFLTCGVGTNFTISVCTVYMCIHR